MQLMQRPSNSIRVRCTTLNTKRLNVRLCCATNVHQSVSTAGTWKTWASSVIATIVQASPGPLWTLNAFAIQLETKTMSYPAMLRLILITLVTLSAVTVVHSLVLAGETKLIAMGLILLPYHTMLQNILLGLDVLYPLGNTIPMLKRFGSGGPLCILS